MEKKGNWKTQKKQGKDLSVQTQTRTKSQFLLLNVTRCNETHGHGRSNRRNHCRSIIGTFLNIIFSWEKRSIFYGFSGGPTCKLGWSQDHPILQIYIFVKKILYTKLTCCDHPNKNYVYPDLKSIKIWVQQNKSSVITFTIFSQ